MDVQVLIAVEMGVLLLFVAAAVVAFLDVARRVTKALHHIEEHAEYSAIDTLPAIRGALSDVVDVLYPPSGGLR